MNYHVKSNIQLDQEKGLMAYFVYFWDARGVKLAVKFAVGFIENSWLPTD